MAGFNIYDVELKYKIITSPFLIIKHGLINIFYYSRDSAGFDPDVIWEASSYMKKYDDKYNLVISAKSGNITNQTSVVRSVANFIDTNGVVILELVEAVVTTMHDSLTIQRKDK